jgi:hypothetical protein
MGIKLEGHITHYIPRLSKISSWAEVGQVARLANGMYEVVNIDEISLERRRRIIDEEEFLERVADGSYKPLPNKDGFLLGPRKGLVADYQGKLYYANLDDPARCSSKVEIGFIEGIFLGKRQI